MTWQGRLEIRTEGHRDMRDISGDVSRLVGQSGIRVGTAHVFVVGSTAAVGLIEFEPGLRADLPDLLDRLIPASRGYAHEQTGHDGNGHSHQQATLLGQSVTVPVGEGMPILGTWQQPFLIECDVRSRRREVVVTVSGDG